MSWNLKYLQSFELSSILAYRNTLIEGFVKHQRITHHDDGTSSYSSPLTPDKIKATDRWTNGNPSMGFVRLYLQEDFDIPDQKVFWGMNFTDRYYENPYVTRPQALYFLREAIKEYGHSLSYSSTTHAFIYAPKGHPLRGQSLFSQMLHDNNRPTGLLRYQTVAKTPTFNFGDFQINECIVFLPNNGIPWQLVTPIPIFEYTAHGGYLNLE